jgi:3-oxoacyl-[acyl-carrier-protein] synthase-3
MRTVVLGTGHYVPPRVVTNKDLEKVMKTTDEWIQQRSGIQERRFAEHGVGASDLAFEAAKRALENAKLDASEIDCIMFATLSPDYTFPGSGVLLQRLLGLSDKTIPAFDIRNQCSGYLYCIQMADAFIRQGLYKKVLIAGAEVHSTGIELKDRGRDVAVLFGDGAGVTILGATDDESRGVLSTHLHSQGEFAEDLMIECPTSRVQPCRITPEMIEDGRIYPKMSGKLVFKNAVTRMPEVVNEALSKNGVSVEQVDHWFFHQANMRINEFVSATLGIAPVKVYHNIHKYGNLSAGAIPSLLDEVARSGKLKRGDLICMAAFGSGFTWASALLRW